MSNNTSKAPRLQLVATAATQGDHLYTSERDAPGALALNALQVGADRTELLAMAAQGMMVEGEPIHPVIVRELQRLSAHMRASERAVEDAR